MGSLSFRKTLAGYLRTVRAVNCEPEQLMIVSGSQQALEVSARVLFDPGSRVWIEEPSYRLARHVLLGAGCRLVPVPVDQEGLNISAGIKAFHRARGAIVSPSHQFPLGSIMTIARRHQLLEWADHVGSWIIEDDYDSEYRYRAMPVPSLQGMDSHAGVVYIGTFSKTLFPSLRVGYIVIPKDLIDRFVAIRHAMDLFPSQLYQDVLAEFIEAGHYARHVRRTKLLYQERRDILVDSINKEFGGGLEILGTEAGLHLTLKVPQQESDHEIALRAAKQRLWLYPLSSSYFGSPQLQGLILGFGNAPEKDIPGAVERLKRLLSPSRL
jgi:GntR family transcriptional regulator/MocR family aminotransferase